MCMKRAFCLNQIRERNVAIKKIKNKAYKTYRKCQLHLRLLENVRTCHVVTYAFLSRMHCRDCNVCSGVFMLLLCISRISMLSTRRLLKIRSGEKQWKVLIYILWFANQSVRYFFVFRPIFQDIQRWICISCIRKSDEIIFGVIVVRCQCQFM